MASESSHRYVISLLVADRVGILRDITSAVADLRGNIDGISQTVVAGYFTVILTATFDAPVPPEHVQTHILVRFPPGEAALLVRPYDPRAPSRPSVQGDRYVVTVTGTDRRGLLKILTSFLAEKGINIEDWYVEFEPDRVIHIGEVTVPARLDIKQVQDEFRQILGGMNLTSGIQHVNIFRAANEIGAVRPLLREAASHA